MAYLSLVVFFALVFLTAASGAVFKPGAWYETLNKPSWTPPDWAFPVVWSILYLMIAVSGWLVWTEAGWTLALALWLAQLVLNGAWSWLFFGMKRMDLALADVALLWLCIAAFILAAWPISPLAAGLFLPYWLWVSIAATLNLSVLRMNPAASTS